MTLLAAGLALAWLAIVTLAFALAGVLRRLQDLTELLADGGGAPAARRTRVVPALRPTGGAARSIVLVVDDTCGACRLILPAFAADAGIGAERRVLTYAEDTLEWAGGLAVPVDVDPEAYRQLDPPWRPAVALVDADGTVLDARPVGSVESLRRALEEFGEARAAPAHAGTHVTTTGAPTTGAPTPGKPGGAR